MSDLIAALQIFAKYTQDGHPTNCSHDVLAVMVNPSDVSDADKAELERLGFHAGTDDGEFDGCFYSFRFGSA